MQKKFLPNLHQTAHSAVVIDICFELLVPLGAASQVPTMRLIAKTHCYIKATINQTYISILFLLRLAVEKYIIECALNV